MDRWKQAPALATLAAAACVPAGCVQRTISITSEPEGALVWLNDREIGRTPVEVEFDYYGTYDVRLVRPGYEPLSTFGEATAPWWDTVVLDLVAELTSARSRVQWHYELQAEDADPDGLIQRARQMRGRIEAE